MKARITKWRNTLAVLLPKALADEVGLREGMAVEVQILGLGGIEIRYRKLRPTFQQLVAKITPENRHSETEWGVVGEEIW